MAGMSSTALPRPSPSSNSGPASALPSTSRPNPTNNPSGPASTPASLAAGLIPAKSPKSTKSSRRQARESLREADLQSSSSECPSLPRTHRPPRFRSASRERSVGRGTSRDRSGEGGRANRSIPSSVRTINSVKRTSSSQVGKFHFFRCLTHELTILKFSINIYKVNDKNINKTMNFGDQYNFFSSPSSMSSLSLHIIDDTI